MKAFPRLILGFLLLVYLVGFVSAYDSGEQPYPSMVSSGETLYTNVQGLYLSGKTLGVGSGYFSPSLTRDNSGIVHGAYAYSNVTGYSIGYIYEHPQWTIEEVAFIPYNLLKNGINEVQDVKVLINSNGEPFVVISNWVDLDPNLPLPQRMYSSRLTGCVKQNNQWNCKRFYERNVPAGNFPLPEFDLIENPKNNNFLVAIARPPETTTKNIIDFFEIDEKFNVVGKPLQFTPNSKTITNIKIGYDVAPRVVYADRTSVEWMVTPQSSVSLTSGINPNIIVTGVNVVSLGGSPSLVIFGIQSSDPTITGISGIYVTDPSGKVFKKTTKMLNFGIQETFFKLVVKSKFVKSPSPQLYGLAYYNAWDMVEFNSLSLAQKPRNSCGVQTGLSHLFDCRPYKSRQSFLNDFDII